MTTEAKHQGQHERDDNGAALAHAKRDSKARRKGHRDFALGLITALSPVVVAFISTHPGARAGSQPGADTFRLITLIASALVSGLLGWFLWKKRKVLDRLGRTIAKKNEQLVKLQGELAGEKKNAIRTIGVDQYVSIILRLAHDYGRGDLLLFNVELSSFSNPQTLEDFWEQVVTMPEIRSIRLALPPRKYERWVNIVAHENPKFFRDAAVGNKFLACSYEPDRKAGEDGIAFALYNSLEQPGVHDWGAMFLLDRPFLTEDGQYRHILEYVGNETNLHLLRTSMWDRAYLDKWADSVEVIQSFLVTMDRGSPLQDLLARHRCDKNPEITSRLTRIVGSKRTVDRTHHARIPLPHQLPAMAPNREGSREFKLRYRRDVDVPDKEEEIEAFCVGLPTKGVKPCIIWATGFGDGDRPKLAQKLSRRMKKGKGDVVEVFFTKSGDIRNTTCTRVTEDIQAVLDYVVDIPGVDRQRICIAGISLCGYLAATVAARDGRVRSVLLICAPFDIIEMLDNFRAHYWESGGRVPRFEDFVKARWDSRIAQVDMNPNYCSYFNHVVMADHLVDIAVKGPRLFDRNHFLSNMSRITKDGRRVAIVYCKRDPIVEPETNIPLLTHMIDKGEIRSDRILHEVLPVGGHYYPPRPVGHERSKRDHAGLYPFDLPEGKSAATRVDVERYREVMTKAIQFCLEEKSGSRARAQRKARATRPSGPKKKRRA